MKVSEMNGIELAQEVTKRFDSIKGEEGVSVWIGDCQDRFGKLSKEERELFLDNLDKKYGGRKE
jgi:hypothetical protein